MLVKVKVHGLCLLMCFLYHQPCYVFLFRGDLCRQLYWVFLVQVYVSFPGKKTVHSFNPTHPEKFLPDLYFYLLLTLLTHLKQLFFFFFSFLSSFIWQQEISLIATSKVGKFLIYWNEMKGFLQGLQIDCCMVWWKELSSWFQLSLTSRGIQWK